MKKVRRNKGKKQKDQGGNNMKKIAVLFGGCSSEYEVSLESAYAVISHMDREKYEPVLIGITREGKWYLYQGAWECIPEDTWHRQKECKPAVVLPDKELHGIMVYGRDDSEDNSGDKSADKPGYISLDGALPILHGKNGEDGTVQGVLELADIPLIGCNTMSSAVCMDKETAHRLAGACGVKVPKSLLVREEYWKESQSRNWGQQKPRDTEPGGQWTILENKIRALGYPLFVKPLRAGSSFGITRVQSEEQLWEAMEHAFSYDRDVIIEEAIEGFEVGCAVLGTEKLTIGEVDEIQLSDGFFDYTEKYTLKTTKIYVPARISAQKAEEIKKTAEVIYRGLGCSCFARVDMFLTPEGEIYFNEVNTIPGFTSHSRYPSMMKAAGISFEELLDRLIGQVVK